MMLNSFLPRHLQHISAPQELFEERSLETKWPCDDCISRAIIIPLSQICCNVTHIRRIQHVTKITQVNETSKPTSMCFYEGHGLKNITMQTNDFGGSRSSTLQLEQSEGPWHDQTMPLNHAKLQTLDTWNRWNIEAIESMSCTMFVPDPQIQRTHFPSDVRMQPDRRFCCRPARTTSSRPNSSEGRCVRGKLSTSPIAPTVKAARRTPRKSNTSTGDVYRLAA